MDRNSKIIIGVLAASVAAALVLLFLGKRASASSIPSPTPTLTPTPTPIPTPTPTSTPPPPTGIPIFCPVVTVTYTSPNGSTSSITLPQQAGTTITVAQGSSPLLSSNSVQCGQMISVYVYAPNGTEVWEQITYANSNKQFSMSLTTTYLTPGVKYLVYIDLGGPNNNYYFYMIIG